MQSVELMHQKALATLSLVYKISCALFVFVFQRVV